MSIICPNCGHEENAPDSVYCDACGIALNDVNNFPSNMLPVVGDDSSDTWVATPGQSSIFNNQLRPPAPPPNLGQQTPAPLPNLGQQTPAPLPNLGQQIPAPPPNLGQQIPAPPPNLGQQTPAPPPNLGQQTPIPPTVVQQGSPQPQINPQLSFTSGNTAKLVAKQAGCPIPEFLLDGSHAIIGKFDPDTGPADVDLEGFPFEDTVSRQHGEIYREGNQWKIQDIGSTNGIFIKRANETRFGARITNPESIYPGDEIAIAKIRFLFQSP